MTNPPYTTFDNSSGPCDDNTNNRFHVTKEISRCLPEPVFPFRGHSDRDKAAYLRRRGCGPHRLVALAKYQFAIDSNSADQQDR